MKAEGGRSEGVRAKSHCTPEIGATEVFFIPYPSSFTDFPEDKGTGIFMENTL